MWRSLLLPAPPSSPLATPCLPGVSAKTDKELADLLPTCTDVCGCGGGGCVFDRFKEGSPRTRLDRKRDVLLQTMNTKDAKTL